MKLLLALLDAGEMRSPACAEWGFRAGRCTATRDSEAVRFEVLLTSKKEGRMVWKGRVAKDGRIEGTSVWEKAGQAPIRYRFEGRR